MKRHHTTVPPPPFFIQPEEKGYDSFMRLKKISDNLVKASIEAGLVTICGAQFNRVAGKNEDGDDTFTDNSFRESGDIEQDAHNAIGIGWRKDKKKRFYEVLKARESGHTGKKFYLEFNGAYSFMKNTEKVRRVIDISVASYRV